MTVLLFHIERSTSYGKESDQHSKSQAMGGVFSQAQGKWIRGSAGVSERAWYQATAELVAAGILVRIPRVNQKGGSAPTEYGPDWMAIRGALEEAENAPNPVAAPPLFPAPVGDLPSASGAEGGLHQVQRGSAPHADTVSDSYNYVNTVSESRAREEPPPPLFAEDHSPTFSEKEKPPSASALELRDKLEAVMGRKLRPEDSIPGDLLGIAERVGVPAAAMPRWIDDAVAEFRRRSYSITSPKLFVTAASTDLIAWSRANTEYLHSIDREEQLRLQREQLPGSLAEMPAEPHWEMCPACEEAMVLEGVCHSARCVDERNHGQAKAKGAGG